ncbi:MAG: 23S rRNA (guanosine(2251)-2'-O)-methyltransferase RlmB [Cellulosilyticaceae bacterium]
MNEQRDKKEARNEQTTGDQKPKTYSKPNNYKGKNYSKPGFNKEDKFAKPGFNKEDRFAKPGFNKEDRFAKPGTNKEDRFAKSNFSREDRFAKSNFTREDRYKKETQEVEEKKEIDENIVYGRNAVIEILKSGRSIEKIYIQSGENEGSIKKIIGEAKSKGILIQETPRTKLDEICMMEKHQGVVAYVSLRDYVTVDEILNDAKEKGEDPFILILENIQDPHNLGAIIRSAHNAGVHGIIIAKRRAVGLTATVAKSSAGAIEYMKVAKVANIAQTIEELKSKGIWVACADMDGSIIYQDNMKGPIGIVIGSEGDGISRNVRNKCDFVVSIPMYGKVTSLNASVAASILAYEVVRQRNF